jgi:hypothetical protein
MKKPRRIYEPRIFQGRVMEQKDFEQLHKELLQFARIDAVTDDMHKLIEDVWPQTYVRLEQCWGYTACAISVAKGVVWSTVWPAYWPVFR